MSEKKPTAGAIALRSATKPRMPVKALAKKLGVDPDTVRRWRSGAALPPADKLARLEDLLGIPMRAWAEEAQDAPSAPDLGADEDE